MTGNFDINKELLDAMRIIARQEIERCNRDITKTARVINVNNDKTVKIEMDGKQYDNIPNYNGTTLSVNNIVKVTYPQGQASNMYVSGGGEDEIYSNLEELDNKVSLMYIRTPATITLPNRDMLLVCAKYDYISSASYAYHMGNPIVTLYNNGFSSSVPSVAVSGNDITITFEKTYFHLFAIFPKVL